MMYLPACRATNAYTRCFKKAHSDVVMMDPKVIAFHGKTDLVTGASRGLGRDIALALGDACSNAGAGKIPVQKRNRHA